MNKFILLIFCFTLIACEQYQAPDSIGPNGSWWVGGVDGGVYVFIEDDKNISDNIYQGAIYYENDKTVWYKGKFKYNKNASLNYKNKKLYSGWDGERLFLKDNTYLKAMGKIPPL
jgi:hypothetical protein